MSDRGGFPDCCGLDIVTSFHIEKDFRDIPSAENAGDVFAGDYAKYGDLSSVLVLNGRQKKTGHKTLVEKGYKVVGSFFNPKHSSVCYLYFRDAYPTFNPNYRRFSREFVKHVSTDGYETVRLKKDGLTEAVPDDWSLDDEYGDEFADE